MNKGKSTQIGMMWNKKWNKEIVRIKERYYSCLRVISYEGVINLFQNTKMKIVTPGEKMEFFGVYLTQNR